jgi:rare lipoprotein A
MNQRCLERISMKLKDCLKLAVVFAMIAILSGCFSKHKHDGPPDYDVDVSKIPNAVPKPEPLAKYGNMRSYRALGKRYYTMNSNRNFVQTGTASWYGTMFHERRTSSGEKYDMLAMTAAHKTLPLPTYVEVTNLQNHRKIIVKVNDRGPFASDRIIDLSYVAAKKLGMLGRGTAHVRIKAINPYTYAQANAKAAAPVAAKAVRSHSAPASQYIYLQAGAFKNKSYALQLKKRLSARLTFPVRVANPALNSKLYRVKIGPIHDRDTANEVSEQLKSMGIAANKIRET